MLKKPALLLLVEDDEDHAELVSRQLADHEVANKLIWLRDGQAALDYLFRHGEYSDPEKSPRPNVILLDLRLPKIDGLEVLKSLKNSVALKGIPVVILTTSNAECDIARAYSHKANSYIIKPLDREEFRKTMTSLGVYWMGWNIGLPQTE